MSSLSLRIGVPLFIFCLFCGISVTMWQNENDHDRELLLRHTQTSAEQIRIRMEGLMNARVSSLELLAERWVERTPPDFSRDRFLQFAEAFYSHYPGFYTIHWISPEGDIQWGFPQERIPRKSKSVFDHPDTRYADAFRKVREALIPGTTPCMDINGSGLGFYAIFPLIHEGGLQGYLEGAFQMEMVITISLAKDILRDFWVRLYDDEALVYFNGIAGHGNAERSPYSAERTVQFPGKSWRLVLENKEPVDSYLSIPNPSLLVFGLVISIALSLALYSLIFRLQLLREARDHALRELTERNRAEKALLENEQKLETLLSEIAAKNEELETFVYTVSHDLKTPIVTIEGFLGAFREDFAEHLTEQSETYFRYMSEATLKMETLINDLLELSRVGRLTETITRFSFEELIKEVLATLEPKIQEKGIEVRVQENLPMVYGERKRIVQVLENLLSNAVKYIGKDNPSARIEIGAQEENGRPVFYVRDNGIGIEERYFDKIFQVFQRLPQAQRVGEGTGIGLTTAKRIIEHHGGKIWLTSKPGEGTTFFFTIQTKEE